MERLGTARETATAAVPLRALRRGYWGSVIREFTKNKGAVAGLVVLLLVGALTLIALFYTPYDPLDVDVTKRLQGPSLAHWLGTDQVGRDVLSRILAGARITLSVAFAATLLAVVAGAVMGLVAGYFGGTVDFLISRVIDILMSMPGLLLAIALVAILGPRLDSVLIAIGVASTSYFARVARAGAISQREEDYVLAARAVGVGSLAIMRRHIFPNVLAILVILASLRLGVSVLYIATLSFIGMGAQPPSPEWGAMINAGRAYVFYSPHIILFPGLAIMLVVIGSNLVGDGLRDALDPRLRKA